MGGRKSSKSKPQKSVDTTNLRTNEKGEIIQWDRNSRWGKQLTALFDAGVLTTETAKEIKLMFYDFRVFNTRTLNSAVRGEHMRKQNEAEMQKQKGSDST